MSGKTKQPGVGADEAARWASQRGRVIKRGEKFPVPADKSGPGEKQGSGAADRKHP